MCLFKSREPVCLYLLEVQLSKRRKTKSDFDLGRPFSQSMPRNVLTRRLSGPPSQIPASLQVPFHSPPASPGPALSVTGHCPNHLTLAPEGSFLVPPELYSQSTDTRKRKRVADWVNSFEALQKSGHRSSASQVSSSESSSPVCPGTATRARTQTPEAEEEYDTWEAGAASLQEIMELQRELVGSGKWAFTLKSRNGLSIVHNFHLHRQLCS